MQFYTNDPMPPSVEGNARLQCEIPETAYFVLYGVYVDQPSFHGLVYKSLGSIIYFKSDPEGFSRASVICSRGSFIEGEDDLIKCIGFWSYTDEAVEISLQQNKEKTSLTAQFKTKASDGNKTLDLKCTYL